MASEAEPKSKLDPASKVGQKSVRVNNQNFSLIYVHGSYPSHPFSKGRGSSFCTLFLQNADSHLVQWSTNIGYAARWIYITSIPLFWVLPEKYCCLPSKRDKTLFSIQSFSADMTNDFKMPAKTWRAHDHHHWMITLFPGVLLSGNNSKAREAIIGRVLVPRIWQASLPWS